MNPVTILVAVLNKAETIQNCVESLLKLKYSPTRIMIVDGYSTDGTYEILQKYASKIDVLQFPKNLSKTFNWALDQIRTEYTVLTDGDCVVDTNWLSELMKSFDKDGVVAVAGYCGTPDKVSTLQKIIGLELENRFRKFPKYISRAPTMNLAMKTEAAKKVRFDEKQMVGVETEFGYRLTKLGKMVYNPKAKVFHYHRSNLKDYFKQQKNQAKWGLRLLFKHGRRAIADQITTFSMSIQIPLLFLGLFSLISSFFNILFLYSSLIFFFFLFIIYFKNTIEIKPPLSYYPLFWGLFLFRNFAWLIGIFEGVFCLPKFNLKNTS